MSTNHEDMVSKSNVGKKSVSSEDYFTSWRKGHSLNIFLPNRIKEKINRDVIEEANKKTFKNNGDKEVFIKKTMDKKFKTAITTNPVPYGPLVKNQQTYDFEFIAKSLLRGDDVTFKQVTKVDEKKATQIIGVKVSVGDREFDLNDIVQKMDLRFVEFDENSKENYINFIENNSKVNKHETDRNIYPKFPGSGILKEEVMRLKDRKENPKHNYEGETIEAGKLNDLHYAEMAAVNIYTQDYYRHINDLLRSDWPKFSKNDSIDTKKLKEVIIHTTMAASGLNKSPDKTIDFTYRVDKAGLPDSLVKDRKKSVESNKDNPYVTFETGGFLSSSKERPAEAWVGGTKYGTTFYNVIGKNVESISYFHAYKEREVLLPPTQMQWVSYKTEGNRDYFLARPVYTPLGLRDAKRNKMGTEIYTEEDPNAHQLNLLNSLSSAVVEMIDSTPNKTRLKNHLMKIIKNEHLSNVAKLNEIKKEIAVTYGINSSFSVDLPVSNLVQECEANIFKLEQIKQKMSRNDDKVSVAENASTIFSSKNEINDSKNTLKEKESETKYNPGAMPLIGVGVASLESKSHNANIEKDYNLPSVKKANETEINPGTMPLVGVGVASLASEIYKTKIKNIKKENVLDDNYIDTLSTTLD
jgi:hypothetical protein